MEKRESYASVGEMFAAVEAPLGMMTGSTDPAIIEILGHTGFDFVVIDAEHGPIGLELAGHLFRAAEAVGLLALIRLTHNDPVLIMKMLDAGAKGVVIPHIDTAEEVRRAVEAVRFAPHGPRGWCPCSRAARYSIPYWTRHSEEAGRATAVIPLIESARAVAGIEEILAVPEVELVFFGPGDLSHELGVVGEGLASPVLQDHMDKVLAAARRAGKKVLGFPFPEMTVESARACLARGFDAMCFGMDLLLFTELCRDVAGRLGRGRGV